MRKLKIMGIPHVYLEAVTYITCAGPGIPILSYSYKSGIRPLITPGHQSEIDVKPLWKNMLSNRQKGFPETKTTEDKLPITDFICTPKFFFLARGEFNTIIKFITKNF